MTHSVCRGLKKRPAFSFWLIAWKAWWDFPLMKMLREENESRLNPIEIKKRPTMEINIAKHWNFNLEVFITIIISCIYIQFDWVADLSFHKLLLICKLIFALHPYLALRFGKRANYSLGLYYQSLAKRCLYYILLMCAELFSFLKCWNSLFLIIPLFFPAV